MFLFDTNIFLEILLGQNKSNLCQKLLEEKTGKIFISDFSLHSIGVILFRYRKEFIFNEFLIDTLSKISIATLSKDNYTLITEINEKYKLDFDDSYQFLIARQNNFTLITLDSDFLKITKEINVIFA